ncbi:hypothetical protein P3602_21475 [Vibrio parahaemolyticus]|uniref:hypothetical protein n=1 Tax=Vibrio TaxID=662 RepID=UPI001B8398B9|nr:MULTISPECIES: hypothetical protein [Vibrio]MDF5108481.1 hypothetical protein [Vibrio parahaemolyticus]MCA2420854.1 hypothetical protein [Vibrio alginolyticus]MCA2445628.1 hypothetical protein [Vibrio alginolyticus]MDF5143386.1 hypothetical protein [Vibrio parahaemolyticus]MDF5153812.1 hypothetical protein [Vibrio parahaemolyticus]
MTKQNSKPTTTGQLKLRVGTLTHSYAIETEEYIDVVDLKDAREKWREHKEQQDYNRYTLGGDVFDGDEVVAVFSPNGRCFKPSDKGNEYFKRLPSDELIDID